MSGDPTLKASLTKPCPLEKEGTSSHNPKEEAEAQEKELWVSFEP